MASGSRWVRSQALHESSMISLHCILLCSARVPGFEKICRQYTLNNPPSNKCLEYSSHIVCSAAGGGIQNVLLKFC